FGICKSRKSKRAGTRIDIIHQKMISPFMRGISSSSFNMRSGHGKSFNRSMNCVAEMATCRLARLEQDSLAARPTVKLRSTGTLSARVTARFGSIRFERLTERNRDRIWDALRQFREESSSLE